MLVLTRKEGEKVMIGDDIEVTLCRINGNRIRLGIEAPLSSKIFRGEVAPDTSKIPKTTDRGDV